MCPRVESNHDLRLRRPTLNPLSYGDESFLILLKDSLKSKKDSFRNLLLCAPGKRSDYSFRQGGTAFYRASAL